ncbi:6-phospho-beta-glucosidase [Paractinoplanes atraurantiacus]|uniref:6-phospho-beta-glucosidase n=1 Tax=Paractinoplanes atraurantiacus TaxID=1036182 RepID=A0A285HWX8_9ACTN|nr:6-phospho-beta-glucosidase [Actinoplanes atraurantiacus]SNY40242.1 6-phospho-beta-glucosidase [Actinoplanes atraurantiacus]
MRMSTKRLVILGGGGFRVPLVYGALLSPSSPIGSVVLHDVDPGRLAAIARVLRAQALSSPAAPSIETTTDLTEALTGADFVFSAIRVHGLEGRVIDERVALAEGMLGQETVGAGGISYGLRTVPVADAIARRIKLVAPDAWVINFTNPAGLVTEAMAAHLGDRVIGICDSPSALGRRVVRALGLPDARVSYAGLNHLGWLTGVQHEGADVLPRLLNSSSLLESFEEGRLFGAAKIRELGAVPNEYLHYYYDHAALVKAELAAPETRGEYLLRQQRECYAMLSSQSSPLEAWNAARRQRDATYMAMEGLGERDDAEGGGYEDVALALMLAIARDAPTSLILNVRNQGTLPLLDDDAVVEVPCAVDGSGARPLPGASIPAHGAELVKRLKAAERAVLSAASSGSRSVAVRALASHPLIDSVPVARRLMTGYQANFPELSYLR